MVIVFGRVPSFEFGSNSTNVKIISFPLKVKGKGSDRVLTCQNEKSSVK